MTVSGTVGTAGTVGTVGTVGTAGTGEGTAAGAVLASVLGREEDMLYIVGRVDMV